MIEESSRQIVIIVLDEIQIMTMTVKRGASVV